MRTSAGTGPTNIAKWWQEAAVQPPRAEARIVIPYTLVACISPSGYLMLQRARDPFAGRWNFIGGKIECGETGLQSAKREVFEEAGLEIAAHRLRFQGIAVWPGRVAGDLLTGMLMFSIWLRSAGPYRSQLSFIQEGVLSWVPEHAILSQDGIDVVPNMPVLLPQFRNRQSSPALVFHAEDHDGEFHAYTRRIPASQTYIADRHLGPWAGTFGEIVDTGDFGG